MIEPWELILHHTYAGTPGVAFDHSPGHGSHGTAVGLRTEDFVLDGSTTGSGAVGFRRNAMISVAPTSGWDRLGGFRAEMVFRLTREGNGHLINGRPLSLFCLVSDEVLDFGFKTTDGAPGAFLGWHDFSVNFADFGINPRTWTKVGVLHDGAGTVQIQLNGQTVATWLDRPLQPVRPMTTVTIGNEPGGALPFQGLIDDVKVWRPNPTRLKADFTDRIVKAGVTDCWAEWGKKFRAALDDLAARDGECPARIAHLIDDAMASTLSSVLTHNPATRQAWDEAVAAHQRLWASGDIAEIHPVLISLQRALSAQGVDIEQNPAFRALADDRCFRELMRIAPPLDCDPQFIQMLTGGRG